MSDRPDRPPAEDVPQPEPRGPEPVVEPVPVHPAAPIQVAPDPGAAPILEGAAEPDRGEPDAPEPPREERPPTEPPRTEETLALPPTTTSQDPPPPSQPEHRSTLEGIAVPFAAPPAERNGGRLAAKLSVGIGGGLLIVIAVVVALSLSLNTLTESYLEKVEDTAQTFMYDVANEQWDDAHELLCPKLQEQPVEDYIEEWDSWASDGAEVQHARDGMSGAYVPVELADGSTMELRILIEQSTESVDTSICGWDLTDG
ncbi:hypothetical protein [Glycomyces arizonensis]|uniref:hypothetical protein n=1 Tax=Glycomyces arizonensis TaxID=256035 RepID=UPI0003F94DF9|nr:hypothetical protein [Glycomyces arizonensis]